MTASPRPRHKSAKRFTAGRPPHQDRGSVRTLIAVRLPQRLLDAIQNALVDNENLTDFVQHAAEEELRARGRGQWSA